MSANAYVMKMPADYVDMDRTEIEFDGGLPTWAWIALGVCAVVMIAGVTSMYIGSQMSAASMGTATTGFAAGQEDQGQIISAASKQGMIEKIGFAQFMTGYCGAAGTALVATW